VFYLNLPSEFGPGVHDSGTSPPTCAQQMGSSTAERNTHSKIVATFPTAERRYSCEPTHLRP
jgi:hypothetical protein